MRYLSLAAAVISASLSAQNRVPNGHFDQGNTGWTLVSMTDPLGTTGFTASRTTGNGPSVAVFSNFQTLTPVFTTTYRSAPFTLVATVPYPVSISVMWEKAVVTPIPQPTVNYVQFRLVDPSSAVITLNQVQVPSQTGNFERASYSGTYVPTATGLFMVELFMRHSNLAAMPYTAWVDDVVVGAPNTKVYGVGCVGSGGYTPVISTKNAPLQGTSNFSVELNDAVGPAPALCALGKSDTTWGPIPLPYLLGAGCSIYSSIDVSLGGIALGMGAGAGTASQLLPVPNNPALSGVRLFTQWFVADAAVANPFTLASTAGLWFTIQ